MRFLVVVSGLTANCSCLLFGTPPPPNHHFESTGNNYNGSYCLEDPFSTTRPYNATEWDATGGGLDCGAPNAIFNTGTIATIALNAAFGAVVDITFTINGFMSSGGSLAIFSGNYRGPDCKGPWVLANIYSAGCIWDPVTPIGGRNGSAIVYPCAC